MERGVYIVEGGTRERDGREGQHLIMEREGPTTDQNVCMYVRLGSRGLEEIL